MSAFARFASACARWAGTPAAFIAALAAVAAWGATGPLFGYSDTWQLIINTSTTVITFWMVFVIQASQNRETKAVHAKLDELIAADEDARNELIHLEDADEKQIDARRLDPGRETEDTQVGEQ